MTAYEKKASRNSELLHVLESNNAALFFYNEKNKDTYGITVKDEKGWTAFDLCPLPQTIPSATGLIWLHHVNDVDVILISHSSTDGSFPDITHTESKPFQSKTFTYDNIDYSVRYCFYAFESSIPSDYRLQIGDEVFDNLGDK